MQVPGQTSFRKQKCIALRYYMAMIRVLERDLDRVHRENRFRLCGRRRISNVVEAG